MSDNHNSAGGVPTTGHLWDDDLADYVNQPPKWWMLGLTASALWVVIYWIMYPAIPLAINGTYFKGVGLPGSGQWTAIKELAEDQAVLDAVRKPYEDKLKAMTPAAILADEDLFLDVPGEHVFGRAGGVPVLSDARAGADGARGACDRGAAVSGAGSGGDDAQHHGLFVLDVPSL